MAQDLGLELYSLHAPFAKDLDVPENDDRARGPARDEITRAAEAAATLGVRHFVIHPGPEKGGFPEHERHERMDNAARVFDAVYDRCRDFGAALVLENMLPHLFTGQVRELLWILGDWRTWG